MHGPGIVSGRGENGQVSMGEQDRAQARIDGLLDALRDAEAGFRQSYSRVLEVVHQLDDEKVGAVGLFAVSSGLLSVRPCRRAWGW